MTNEDFRNALTSGQAEVIFTDVDNKEYSHTILKAGKKEVSLFNSFINKEYKLSFSNHCDYPNYRLR
jgi:hypothetical protein